jgi:hypothetical protein
VTTLLLLALLQTAPAAARCGDADPCTKSARAGELALVFLGDSGFGEGGSSEWGPHSQAAVATRLAALCPRPDLVLFLGDNVYWRGSPDLFAPRFDTMYAPLFDAEQRRVHAALGNHDVKGCQLSRRSAIRPEETCADVLARLVVEDVKRDLATGSALLDPAVMEKARTVSRADCPPAFDLAYEQAEDSGTACYATEALRHQPFGYGQRGGNPLRYYSIDAPMSAPAADADAPRARLVVTDSNTLRRGPGPPPGSPTEQVLKPDRDETVTAVDRWDELQALWVENLLGTAPAAAWRIVVMHHPPYSPRGCTFKFLGSCVGGHADDEALQRALFPTYMAPESAGTPAAYKDDRPDLVIGAHNHFYARSRALAASGYPARRDEPGVRYFVTGGGGAPLYRVMPLHQRYAAAGAYHHFLYLRLRQDTAFFWAIDERGRVRDAGCFRRGESVDRCIAAGTFTDDALQCGEPAPAAGCK